MKKSSLFEKNQRLSTFFDFGSFVEGQQQMRDGTENLVKQRVKLDSRRMVLSLNLLYGNIVLKSILFLSYDVFKKLFLTFTNIFF